MAFLDGADVLWLKHGHPEIKSDFITIGDRCTTDVDPFPHHSRHRR